MLLFDGELTRRRKPPVDVMLTHKSKVHRVKDACLFGVRPVMQQVAP